MSKKEKNIEKNENLEELTTKVNFLMILVVLLMIISIVSMILFVFNKNEAEKQLNNEVNENINEEDEETKDENKPEENKSEENKSEENKPEENKPEDNENKEQVEKVEQLDINTDEVKSLYELIKIEDFQGYNYTNKQLFISLLPEKYFYSKMKIIPTDFNEWNMFFLYLHRFLDFHNFEYENKNSLSTCEESKIKRIELEKALYKLFGTNYVVENFSNLGSYFKYIEKEDSYSFGGCTGDTAVEYIHTKLVKAEKKGDFIYLYEKIGIEAPENSYYSNCIENKQLKKALNGKDIWEYEDDLSTFMYTLKKDDAGEYHLESMEYFELK